MKSLGVLVLRFKRPHGQQWEAPLQHPDRCVRDSGGADPRRRDTVRAGGVIDVLTKKVATISGSSFTAVLLHGLPGIRAPYQSPPDEGDGKSSEVPSGRANGSCSGYPPRPARRHTSSKSALRIVSSMSSACSPNWILRSRTLSRSWCIAFPRSRIRRTSLEAGAGLFGPGTREC